VDVVSKYGNENIGVMHIWRDLDVHHCGLEQFIPIERPQSKIKFTAHKLV
jgi:hypothetical protein